MNTYLQGNVVRLLASFTNSAGTPVDPSSLTLYHGVIRPQASAVQSLVYGQNSIVRASVGVFYSDVPVNSSGDWRYRWEGLGDNQAAIEGGFSVSPWSVR